MTKKIEAICDICESSFAITFNQDLVPDYSSLVCPFCGEAIDCLSENESSSDVFEDDFLDD